MKRRDFIYQTGILRAQPLLPGFVAEAAPPRSKMGIASTSFAGAEIPAIAARQRWSPAAQGCL
jgi:hypothetical protein